MAARIVQNMGGEVEVLKKAVEAYEKGNSLSMTTSNIEDAKLEWQYAAELATYPLPFFVINSLLLR